MKLCTFKAKNRIRLGIAAGGNIADTQLAAKSVPSGDIICNCNSMIDLLENGKKAAEAVKQVGELLMEKGRDLRSANGEEVVFSEEEIEFLPPVPRPGKILCIAGNYLEHVREGEGRENAPRPADIHVFTKPGSTAPVGHNEVVCVNDNVDKLDYELELGVVIGLRGRYIPEDKAREHIGGYTIFNDISDREYMPTPDKNIHWFFMKAQDQSAAMGPYLSLARDLVHPLDLEMKLWVNGDLRQHTRTSNMIFSPEWIVHRISHFVTLEPGDVIATGTCGGNGWSRGGMYLRDGDVVELEIENIGRLCNTVAFEEPKYRRG